MRIMYIDDEKRMRDEFLCDHGTNDPAHGHSVTCHDDARSLVARLETVRESERPDVLVIDLYATNDAFDSDEAKTVNTKVDELVVQIATVREELQKYVLQSKHPVGLDALRQLRNSRDLKHIPVILRTREGLALLDDDLLRDSIELDADWMLKGKEPASRRQSERELIERAHRRQQALESHKAMAERVAREATSQRRRELVIATASVLVGALLSYFLS